MPGFYQKGEYDVSGTIVGVVEKSAMLDGKTIKAGDTVIGIAPAACTRTAIRLLAKSFSEN